MQRNISEDINLLSRDILKFEPGCALFGGVDGMNVIKKVIKRLDSDTLTSRKSYQSIFKDFYDKKINILVGTQIISKGLDFPEVTLVGVINADIGLLHPDFRASEKTFQILTQVSGRSGRSEKKGEVLIQTNHSEYYVFENVKNHDFLSFYENEINSRRVLNYPPFSRIAIIETASKEQKLSESKIKELFNYIHLIDKQKILEILPPSQPLFAKLKDMYRYHILIKSKKDIDASGNYLIKNNSIEFNDDEARIALYSWEWILGGTHKFRIIGDSLILNQNGSYIQVSCRFKKITGE